MEDPEKLFTTAEIMLATGLPRGTITSRAKALGYARDGFGYTAEQVMRVVTMPYELHRKNEQNAAELRKYLREKMEEQDLPLKLVELKGGEWGLEYLPGKKKPIAGGTAKGGQPEG